MNMLDILKVTNDITNLIINNIKRIFIETQNRGKTKQMEKLIFALVVLTMVLKI